MNALPILIVSSACPGLLTVNGGAALDVDGSVALPVARSGDILLCFIPYGAYLPVAQRLSLHGGQALLRDSRWPVTVWPDGVIEVEFSPVACERLFPPREIDRLEHGGVAFSLVKHDGVTLLAEDAEYDRELLRLHLPGAQTGSLRTGGDGIAAAALVGYPDGRERLLLLAGDRSGVRVALDMAGTALHMAADGAVTAMERLGDEAGHRVLLTAAPDGSGGWARSRAALPPERPISGRSAHELGLRLMQAVLLGERDEALGYLAPQYAAGLTYSGLAQFFGTFTSAGPARYSPPASGEAVLAAFAEPAEGCRTATLFAFRAEGGAITSIRRYE